MTVAAGPESPLFVNRELSWLAFNTRVLLEAIDPTTPLLERVKFAAITASNLDEFFMVRVAGLMTAADEGDTSPDLAGMPPAGQLEAISDRAHALVAMLSRLLVEELIPMLAANRIRLLGWDTLGDAHRASLGTFFVENVLPVLTPLAIDVARPFPRLSSLHLNIAVLLEAADESPERRLAIVQVPPGLTRLVQVIAENDSLEFVLLEEIIRAHILQLFPGQRILETTLIRLLRDSELELDHEGGRTRLELVEHQLRRRRHGDVIRLDVEQTVSDDLLAMLQQQLEVGPQDIYKVPTPLDPRVLMGLVDLPGFDALRDPPQRSVNLLTEEQSLDLFSVLDERDILLHHPYDAYDPVVALIAQAAEDPDVLALKQTLYRTNASSRIISSLQRAARDNKHVTVLVELTARFDEERNIRWARELEEAGAHVIYGVRGFKTHAKICLIVRKSPQGLRRYVHLGTGNYNERTARAYTDFSLMTSSQSVAEDATAFFSALTGYSDPPRLKKLTMAPTGLRRKLIKMIERERRRAEAGQPAEIVAKMNSLIDAEIIHALIAASRAGVPVRLNVRGICALLPGVAGASHNVEVVSVIDRFLEHSRAFYFLNGGDDEVYLASADWMTRNLDKRVELMFPVDDIALKTRVVQMLRAMFRDNQKGHWLAHDGTYHKRSPAPGDAPFRVQEYLQDDAERRVSAGRGRERITLIPQRGAARDPSA